MNKITEYAIENFLSERKRRLHDLNKDITNLNLRLDINNKAKEEIEKQIKEIEEDLGIKCE